MYSQWMDLLTQINLFENLKNDELVMMLHCLKPKIVSYERRECIMIEGRDSTGIGIVLEGEAIVARDGLAGDRRIISKLNTGDIFGEIAAFVGNKSLTTVESTTSSTIMFLPSYKIVETCPKVCNCHKTLIRNMLEVVSQKVIVLNKKVEILSLKSIREKISNFLLEQYNINKSLEFEIPFKRHELAEYLNTTRPSLSRELIKMKDEGIIDFNLNFFRIIDLETLKPPVR